MARSFFAYILHKDGKVDDTAAELAEAARRMDPGARPVGLVAGHGADLEAACAAASEHYAEVWKISGETLGYVTSEAVRPMLVGLLPAGSVVLLAHEHFGMDLGPGLSVKLGGGYLPDAVGFEPIQGDRLEAVRQEYSGQVSTHVSLDLSQGAVVTVRPGAFAVEGSGSASGQVVDKSAEASGYAGEPGRRYLEVVEAEVGDVDITKSEVLVSVGRGIEDEENLELVHELAEAMGADVSCSRPIVDAKWLEKSRQVGTSGQTVKPKVYLACGISGSFQHMGGIKGNPFIVAVNKNPKAPIFQVADVGVVADILEFLPELTEKIQSAKG